jgi:hypothetical protein
MQTLALYWLFNSEDLNSLSLSGERDGVRAL